MRLTIFLIIIIIFIIIFYKKIKEPFFSTNINLENKTFNSKHNIFLGYTEEESNNLKKKLEEIDEFDMKKSNFILNDNPSRNFNNISIGNNLIDSNSFEELIGDDNEYNIKYFNTETNADGVDTDTLVLYNHEDQQKGITPPNKLCIENECIDKIHLGIANGSHTLKLNNYNNPTEYIIPIYTYSGGNGYVRFGGHQQENNPDQRPFEYIFYQWNKLVDGPYDYGRGGNVNIGYLPRNLNNDYGMRDINYRYRDFKYFALYNAHSNSYLYNAWGKFLGKHPVLTNTCIFEFAGVWNNIQSKKSYNMFVSNNQSISYPLGIKNVAYGKYLCQARTGWGHHKRCSGGAIQDRPWFRSWEEFRLARIIPLSEGNNSEHVYIVGNGCRKALSGWTGKKFCFFGAFDVAAHWRIIPLPDMCGEKCKADYGSKKTNAGIAHLISKPGRIKNNVPKNLQCPIDRPICRYNSGPHESDWLGTCTKEGHMPKPADAQTVNPNHLIPNTEYRYAKPDQRIYKTDYSNPQDQDISEENRNKDFFSEYSINVAKNNKGKFYDPDVFKHFHDHTHT
jgi:hypothetical protein